jgi:hypothetical protein
VLQLSRVYTVLYLKLHRRQVAQLGGLPAKSAEGAKSSREINPISNTSGSFVASQPSYITVSEKGKDRYRVYLPAGMRM